MAREHANIRNDIWNDEDFRRLSVGAQLLYLQLLTSATLTYAGVADWRPKRLAALSRGVAAGDVEEAAQELIAGLFIIVDEDTEEVLIRSFLKHDGLLQKPNVAKAMVTAHGKITSMTLKGVLVHELKRLREQFPEWRAFAAGVVDELLQKPSIDPAETLYGRVPGRVPERDAPLLTTDYLLPTTELPATHSAPSAQEIEEAFETAYARWPKKVERKKSLEQFRAAVKKMPLLDLVEHVVTFGDAYAAHVEKQYTPALNVWLRGERWTDDLPQPSSQWRGQTSNADRAWVFVNELGGSDGTARGGDGVGARLELR